MRRVSVRSTWARVLAVLAVLACAAVPLARAQGVTTASVTGIVSDSANAPLAGAHVLAVHRPSGTSYVAATDADGRFTIPGMRVGGPYVVTVSAIGYRPVAQDRIFLQLGVGADLHFKLGQVSVQLEALTVQGQTDPVFSSERTGAATAVTADQVTVLPTISRRVEDLLRLTPQYSPNSFGYSFAGQMNFYNNMTIDGAYFNNSFGLGGQPGDRTGVAAVSLDALEQLEVNVAPYDVRQGNFVGAGVNMVTRSGTNDFRGSLFYNLRNNSFVGTKAGPNTYKPGTFKYNDIGATLGGPILRNKLFFFLSYENDANTFPATSYTANDGTQSPTGTVTRVLRTDLDSLSSYLLNNFHYTTGPYQGYDFKVPSTRFLARLDYNINDRNKVSLRYNLLNSSSPTLISNSTSLGRGNRRSSNLSLNFANSNYAILEDIRSIVGEWNSLLSNTMSNNLIVGYTSNDESRTNNQPPWFPEVEILNAGTNYTTFGFEPFTPDNQLKYHSFQLQDNLTVRFARHAVTLGFSYEKYHSYNVFFPGSQSVYVYNSLADWYTDANDYLANPNRTVSPVTLNRFQLRYSNIPGQTEPVQPLDVQYSGVYAQDEFRPTPNLTFTAGLRLDWTSFKNTAYDNSFVDTLTFLDQTGAPIRYNSGKMPAAKLLWSPRLGFNYDVGGRHQTQVRGGTGVFTGRPAYVWISNQVGNTGVLTGFIQSDGTTAYPFNPDPYHYAPATVTGAPAASFEFDVTAPGFKFPQVWRSNIAVDQRLPWGLTGTAEFLYTKDINGVGYINANLPAAQTQLAGPDTRPRWTATRLYNRVTSTYVLFNTDLGYAYNLSFSLEQPERNGLYWKAGFTTGESFNAADPGSTAATNWSGIANTGNPNRPVKGYTSFSPGSRLFAAVTYARDFFGFGETTLGLYFSGNTNGNGSYVVNGDLNGDGVSGNDLIFIPRQATDLVWDTLKIGAAGPSQVVYTPAQQAAAFDAYINQDNYLSKHRGQYAQRNAAFLPMVWRADLSLSQDVGRMIARMPQRLQVRLDILNLTNLINHNWGVSQGFVNLRPISLAQVDGTGTPHYRMGYLGTNMLTTSYQKNTSASEVWRLQLGVKYFFNQ